MIIPSESQGVSTTADGRAASSSIGGCGRIRARLPVLLSACALATSVLSLFRTNPVLNASLLSGIATEDRVPPAAMVPEPIRFIAVAGLYHSGTTAMWNSIKANEGVAQSKGANLTVYGMTEGGGYPPCGTPLLSDSSVDMGHTMEGDSGIVDKNPLLNAEWGTLWGDWNINGPKTFNALMKMKPPHEQDTFYTWWKHTPPQHPVLACFRPDTLYVVMVRHPKAWEKSMKEKLYEFQYFDELKQWILKRSNPRRLPPLEMRFRSLFNVWSYYLNGYLGWEWKSVGRNCYEGTKQGTLDREGNCLWEDNLIPNNHRNIVIVRYEDYIHSPNKTLAQIFSFATRGLIDATKDEELFAPFEQQKLSEAAKILETLKKDNFFSLTSWDTAHHLPDICERLGYSCDESSNIFVDEIKR